MSEFEPNFRFIHLAIQGHAQRPLPNLYLRLNQTAHTLALALPGLHYSNDMPALYYPSRLLLRYGIDVLQVQADYNRQEFQTADPLEKALWLGSDALAALLAGLEQRDYEDVVLMGKSLGTLSLARLLQAGVDRPARLIWLTPLFAIPAIAAQIETQPGPSLLVCAQQDSTFDAQAFQRLEALPQVHSLLLPQANHVLEIPDDPQRSLAVMERVLARMATFLEETQEQDPAA